MKLYTSLIYRGLKLTRKHCIIMLILFLLLSLLLLAPVMLGDFDKPGEKLPVEEVVFFVGIVSLVGGVMAGTNNGLQKADISSGWKRYSYVLPPTAKQQAMSDLLVELCYILFFGLSSAAYTWIYSAAADYNAFGIMLNIYLGAVCAIMLIDIAYSYIIMFAKTKKDLGIIGIIAFFGAGVILKVVGLFINVDFPEQPNEDGDLISDEAINSFVTKLSSGKLTLCIFAVFVVLCVLFFLAMWRSHERREP